MLLALAYHRVGSIRYGNLLPVLERHFAWIANNYPTALPGEVLKAPLTLCLTFDDATFDFYHWIYPLLQRYGLKATLAVPTAFILKSTSLSPEKRLDAIKPLTPTTPPLASPMFCSWEELKLLSQSPLIQIASHSTNHLPLTTQHVNATLEIEQSKQQLESTLCCPIKTFVYPFGCLNPAIHRLTKKHYAYAMRLGSAMNLNWGGKRALLYRVPADNLTHFKVPFLLSNRLLYFFRFFFNVARQK